MNGSDRTGDRLDSWKEIAAYLKRGARTVQRWEREEGLPVHRLVHDKLGSIYAYRSELDAWWSSHADTREIRRPLRVGALLEGSVGGSGDRLRITVQLTDVESGLQLWSGRYDRGLSDIFAIQRDIAENVVRALDATLSSATGATLW